MNESAGHNTYFIQECNPSANSAKIAIWVSFLIWADGEAELSEGFAAKKKIYTELRTAVSLI